MAIEVDFAELADGSLVEMIEDPTDATKTLLAVYNEGAVRYAETVEDRGRTLVPLSRADENVRYVGLAQGAEACGQICNLIANVSRFLGLCLDLGPDSLCLLTAFVISSWFTERLLVAPYLALVGPPGSGKTTAMKVLGTLCYRSFLAADITAPAFFDIAHRIRPTVFLDETLTNGNPRELIHLLKVSSTPGFVSLRRGKARLAFGPKVFSWIELPNDAALNSRCLIAPLQRTLRTDLMYLNNPAVLGQAKRIRMQLQQFRFERLRNLSVPKTSPSGKLSGRSFDLYRALALPFDQDHGMCDFLEVLIAEQDRCQARLLSPGQVSTIRVLDVFIHAHPSDAGVWMQDLTGQVNSDLASRGEPYRLNERKLGDILTSLSFTNRTRRNTGYILWLDRADRARIHAATRDYGVEGTHGGPIESCEICIKASAPAATTAPTEAPEEKKLQSEDPKGERRERRERQTHGRRPRVRAKRLHFQKS